jgi:hypothetical protein
MAGYTTNACDYPPFATTGSAGFYVKNRLLARWLQVRLGRLRLSPSCPFRLLHTCMRCIVAVLAHCFAIRATAPSRRSPHRRRDPFSGLSVVSVGTTKTRFLMATAAPVWHGHSKDHRPDLKQMLLSVAMDGGDAQFLRRRNITTVFARSRIRGEIAS